MMLRSRASKRYAAVLFDAAADAVVLDAVRLDASSLQAAIGRNPDLRRFLADYRMKTSVRQRALHEFFEGRLHALMFRFILFVESKKRLGLTAEICDDFVESCDHRAGLVRGRLDSAFPVEGETVEAIRGWARSRVGEQLDLTVTVDSGLYGGFRLRVEDVVYDLSVAAQLRRLKEQMINA